MTRLQLNYLCKQALTPKNEHKIKERRVPAHLPHVIQRDIARARVKESEIEHVSECVAETERERDIDRDRDRDRAC